MERLSDPYENVRRRSAFALGRISAESPAAAEALMETLATDSPAVRTEAAKALGGIRRPEAVAALVAGLADASVRVRAAAAEALGAAGDETATAALLRAAREDSAFEVRRAADEALARLKRR